MANRFLEVTAPNGATHNTQLNETANEDERSYAENMAYLRKLRRIVAIGYKAISKVRGEIAECDKDLDVLQHEITRLELATDAYVDVVHAHEWLNDENKANTTIAEKPTQEQRDAFIQDYCELLTVIEEYNTVRDRKLGLKVRHQRLKNTQIVRFQQVQSTELTMDELMQDIYELKMLRSELCAILHPEEATTLS